jgi:hypothetical protein
MYTQPTQAAAEPIVVNLTPPEIKAAAGGAPVDIIAEVKNAGTTVDQYSIEIENLDPSWYTVVVPSVSLFPGDSAPIPIRIHPPRGKDTRPGNHAFVVRARSNADPTLIGKTKGVVIIGSFAVFHMELAPKRITGFRGNYKLTINNGANNDLQLALNAEDPDESLRFNLKPSEPTISPNSKVVVPMVVSTKAFRLVGDEEKFKFNVIAHPVEGTQEDDKMAQGEFVQKPIFRAWKWPLLILAALLLLLAFLIIRPEINPCSRTFFLFQGIPSQARFYYSLLCQGYEPGPKTPTPIAGTPQAQTQAESTPVSGGKPDLTPQAVPNEDKFISGQGYKEIRATHLQDVGSPLENEWYDKNGVSHQKTSNGQLMYFVEHQANSASGKARIYFINKEGTVYTFVNCNPDYQFNSCDMVLLTAPTGP